MHLVRVSRRCLLFGLLSLSVASIGAQTSAPRYEVDRAWPKSLPNQWVLGGLGGVCVDNQDHVFILNRQDVLEPDLNAGRMAPLIIELDSSGEVVNSWGDPALLDPRLHSCHADRDNNIWIASSPSGMVQKYSHDGRSLLLQIGKKGMLDSSDGTAKGQPLNSNGDVYVSDGENPGGNRPVAVMDRSGTFLRQWRPDGMNTVHCRAGTNDGLIYVCNRQQSRIQTHDKTGRLLRNIEVPWKPVTAPNDGKPVETGGSAAALDVSRDVNQRLMFVINQNNSRIEIIDRETGAILANFGRAGHFAGEFDQPHGIAVDSKGNVYVAENRGKRVQKFVPVSGR